MVLGAALTSALSEVTVSCPSLEGTSEVTRKCCEDGSVAIGEGEEASFLGKTRGGSGGEVRGGSGSASSSGTTASGANELFE